MDAALIAAINQQWRPEALRAARIVHHLLLGCWHYSVALSDSFAASWGPRRKGMWGGGRIEVHPIAASCRDVTNVDYLPLTQIHQNLIASVAAFHHDWRYGLHGWNCEHWARLVATGDPVSYQVAQTGWGFFDMFHTLRRHRSAKQHLTAYIG